LGSVQYLGRAVVAVASPDEEWLTVAETAKAAGCTVGWVRLLLGDGRLNGWRAGQRAWLVHKADAEWLKSTLTVRSVGRREVKPATPKPRKYRKK
jgi:excisionase family DNA binding protein